MISDYSFKSQCYGDEQHNTDLHYEQRERKIQGVITLPCSIGRRVH